MRSRFLAACTLGVLAPLVGTTGPASASVPLPTPGTVQNVLVQSDGKLVVSLRTTATDRFTLVRLRPDSALDPTFGGGDGIASATVTSSSLDPDPSDNRTETEVLISSEPTG